MRNFFYPNTKKPTTKYINGTIYIDKWGGTGIRCFETKWSLHSKFLMFYICFLDNKIISRCTEKAWKLLRKLSCIKIEVRLTFILKLLLSKVLHDDELILLGYVQYDFFQITFLCLNILDINLTVTYTIVNYILLYLLR